MKLEFSYELLDNKWAKARISDGEHELMMEVWYLSPDAVGDLLRALSALLRGTDNARVIWEDDPGQYRWVFHRQDEHVDVEILHFPVTYSTAEDRYGRVVFRTTVPMIKLAKKVYRALYRLISNVGLQDYQHRWGQDFPLSAYNTLHEQIQAYK